LYILALYGITQISLNNSASTDTTWTLFHTKIRYMF